MVPPMYNGSCAVPNLTTAQSAPLLHFESLLLQRAADIEAWFRRQWRQTAPPFYGSVDLRNAGFKLAPVDTNLFPAGFNNLNPDFDPLCVQAIQSAFERLMPSACGVLLIPESHTRNRFYLESVARLQDLIQKSGYNVAIGSLNPDLKDGETVLSDSGRQLKLRTIQRREDTVFVDGLTPCLILLNNDLSGGRPEILENLTQPVIPPLGMGWSDRLKTHHFAQYRNVAREFGELLGIDPWWVDPLFRNCGPINFRTRDGEERLANNVDVLLREIGAKYREYGVDMDPFVIVKADAGTYGMAVMTLTSGEEALNLNRNARKKMAVVKEGRQVDSVIVQEGVYTLERWTGNDAPAGTCGATAEPVVYMIDHFVVGGFYRVHETRSNQESLNAPGAHFKPLAFAGTGTYPEPASDPDAQPNRFYAYGVVARLALLAAAREIEFSRQIEHGLATVPPAMTATES